MRVERRAREHAGGGGPGDTAQEEREVARHVGQGRVAAAVAHGDARVEVGAGIDRFLAAHFLVPLLFPGGDCYCVRYRTSSRR